MVKKKSEGSKEEKVIFSFKKDILVGDQWSKVTKVIVSWAGVIHVENLFIKNRYYQLSAKYGFAARVIKKLKSLPEIEDAYMSKPRKPFKSH